VHICLLNGSLHLCSPAIQLCRRTFSFMMKRAQVSAGRNSDINNRGEVMTKIFSRLTARTVLKIAAATGIGLSASGCVYDAGLGLGYASDNYANGNGYDCDPYSPFDSYYDCDYRYGFGNIGFGGGWSNNYYYPGNGFFLFDSFGRRYNMQRDHYRYWGQRRYEWNRGRPHHNGRGGDGRDGYRGRGGYGGGYGGNNVGHDNPISWPERGGKRDHYEGRDRREGRTDNRPGSYPGLGGGLGAAPGADQVSGNPGDQVSQPRMTRSGYIRRDTDGVQSRGDPSNYGNGGRGMPRQGAGQSVQMPSAERMQEPRAMRQPVQQSAQQPRPERSETIPRPQRSSDYGRAMREPNENED
jgi:hypothetical protein